MVREGNTKQQNHTIPSSQRQPESGVIKHQSLFISSIHQLKCDAPGENHCHRQATSVPSSKLNQPMELQLCMQHIRESLGQSIITSDGQDLLDERFNLTIMEDEDKFGGASTSTIRQHFRDWCVHAVNEEQGSNDEIERRRQESVPWL
jgi:hypothetical protein